MTVYFADRKMDIQGLADTELGGEMLIRQDKRTDDLSVGVVSLEFNLVFPSSRRAQAETMTEPGHYLLVRNKDAQEFYTIIDTEMDVDDQCISVYAEGAGLDLINEIAVPYVAPAAMPISDYISRFTYDSGFEIGRNEISTRSRKLVWDGETTVTERLISLATQFDAELAFSFDIIGMKVLHKYINIYEKRGGNYGVWLRRGIEVGNIRVKKSVADLATALKVTGGTTSDGDQPVDLNGYHYDDGDFFVEGTYLKSRSALAKWSRYLSDDNVSSGHLMRTFHSESTNKAEMCRQAITKLKKMREMAVEYEVELLQMPAIHVGDTVTVVDHEGSLYLSARVLKIETSEADDIHTATLGDYLATERQWT